MMSSCIVDLYKIAVVIWVWGIQGFFLAGFLKHRVGLLRLNFLNLFFYHFFFSKAIKRWYIICIIVVHDQISFSHYLSDFLSDFLRNFFSDFLSHYNRCISFTL